MAINASIEININRINTHILLMLMSMLTIDNVTLMTEVLMFKTKKAGIQEF